MPELYNTLIKAFTQLFLNHIRTKSTEWDFHTASAEFYEKVLEMAHKIGEKSEDIGKPIDSRECDEIKKDTYRIIESLKATIETAQGPTRGFNTLLDTIAEDIETICGTAKGFVKEESEEEKTPDLADLKRKSIR